MAYYINTTSKSLCVSADGKISVDGMSDAARFIESGGSHIRSARFGKYTVFWSSFSKYRCQPRNYLAGLAVREKVYGDAYIVERTVMGVPLGLSFAAARELAGELSHGFEKKERAK